MDCGIVLSFYFSAFERSNHAKQQGTKDDLSCLYV